MRASCVWRVDARPRPRWEGCLADGTNEDGFWGATSLWQGSRESVWLGDSHKDNMDRLMIYGGNSGERALRKTAVFPRKTNKPCGIRLGFFPCVFRGFSSFGKYLSFEGLFSEANNSNWGKVLFRQCFSEVNPTVENIFFSFDRLFSEATDRS